MSRPEVVQSSRRHGIFDGPVGALQTPLLLYASDRRAHRDGVGRGGRRTSVGRARKRRLLQWIGVTGSSCERCCLVANPVFWDFSRGRCGGSVVGVRAVCCVQVQAWFMRSARQGVQFGRRAPAMSVSSRSPPQRLVACLGPVHQRPVRLTATRGSCRWHADGGDQGAVASAGRLGGRVASTLQATRARRPGREARSDSSRPAESLDRPCRRVHPVASVAGFRPTRRISSASDSAPTPGPSSPPAAARRAPRRGLGLVHTSSAWSGCELDQVSAPVAEIGRRCW